MHKGRPDGSGQIGWAWTLLLLGLLISLIGIFRDVDTYPSVDLQDLAAKWTMIYVGGAMISASFFLFLAGWIIRALWFLPGRDDAVRLADHAAMVPEVGSDASLPMDSAQETARSPSAFLIVVAVLVLLGAVLSYGEYQRQQRSAVVSARSDNVAGLDAALDNAMNAADRTD